MLNNIIEKGKELYFKYEEIINYLIVGGIATVISLAVKFGLLYTILDAKDAFQLQVSVVCSWFFACLFAYFANRKYVFKSSNENIVEEMSKFFGGRIATLLLDAGFMWFFVTFLGMNSKIQVFVLTLICQFLVIVGNYFLSKLLVFKDQNKA